MIAMLSTERVAVISASCTTFCCLLSRVLALTSWLGSAFPGVKLTLKSSNVIWYRKGQISLVEHFHPLLTSLSLAGLLLVVKWH